mgnify:CR=1 FL=1
MTTAFPISSEVYLDANFLVAYLISSHADARKAQKLFAKLLVSGNTLVFSALTVDETMLAVKRTLFSQEKSDNLKKGKNYKDYIKDIRNVVKIITNNSSFRITQFRFPVNGCNQAVENIDKYIMRPRDAFHLSYMQDQSIKYIASNDKDFNNVKKIIKLKF